MAPYDWFSCADKCVLDSCRYLQQRGWDVTYLPVQTDGLVDLGALEAAMRPDTAIVSVMFVNNEIGAPCACALFWHRFAVVSGFDQHV